MVGESLLCLHHSRLTGTATQSLYPVHVLFGSRPNAFRQFALLFSAIARFVKASALIAVAAAIRDSEWEQIKTPCRHSCLHRAPRHVRAREHSEIGESAKKSQQFDSGQFDFGQLAEVELAEVECFRVRYLSEPDESQSRCGWR